MKNLIKAAFAIGAAVLALSTQANTQTYNVQLTGLGSSGLFLAIGQAASQPDAFLDPVTGNYDLSPVCVWSEGNNSVSASDWSVSGNPSNTLNDAGSAWVAWTQSSTGSCTSFSASDTIYIYAYLQVDSVVGDRCLFNANLSTPECAVKNYPVSSGTLPANLIYPSSGTCGSSSSPGECSLPGAIGTALNGATLNFSGTDIRPEDAEFAVTRATTACDTPVATGSSYLGLGYSNGGNIDSQFSTSVFHVIDFTLPTTSGSANYSVTTVGASPVVFVVNGTSWPTSTASDLNISSANLAKYLDGTNFTTTTLGGTGGFVTTLIREPLSGTYNTVEYNVPNTISNSSSYSISGSITGNFTSQDVGQNQPVSQVNCPTTSFITGSTSNPMHILTSTSGGERDRAIGTGQELTETRTLPTSTNGVNTLGYGFWSVQNFAPFASGAVSAAYLEVDNVDPLNNSSTSFTGAIPTTAAQIANVDLHNVANGTYPVWSLLRLVNIGASPSQPVSDLANSAQNVVTAGIDPNFAPIANMTAVRSHFTPPASLSGSSYPTTNANGDTFLGGYYAGTASTYCSAQTEAGGDVGGLIISLPGTSSKPVNSDNNYCFITPSTFGLTGQRR
jgi:hypothetical protein